MIFKSTERFGTSAYELQVWIDDHTGEAQYMSDGLVGLRFESLSKLIEAIKKKELEERKAFTNPTAYMLPGYSFSDPSQTVRQVTVTSLRDEHHAWVMGPNGKRGVERLSTLYKTKAQLEGYLKIKKAHTKIVTEAHEAMELWRPER